jgi:hypothetical protein
MQWEDVEIWPESVDSWLQGQAARTYIVTHYPKLITTESETEFLIATVEDEEEWSGRPEMIWKGFADLFNSDRVRIKGFPPDAPSGPPIHKIVKKQDRPMMTRGRTLAARMARANIIDDRGPCADLMRFTTTTIGLEFEASGIKAAVSGPGNKLFYSKEMASNSDIALVSAIRDISIGGVGTLEIVTGPILASDSASWGLLSDFFRAFYKGYKGYDPSSGAEVRIPAATLANHISKHSWPISR